MHNEKLLNFQIVLFLRVCYAPAEKRSSYSGFIDLSRLKWIQFLLVSHDVLLLYCGANCQIWLAFSGRKILDL